MQKPDTDFSDLQALFINTTLTPSPEHSHTETLMAMAQGIMQSQGVDVRHIRAVDYVLPPGLKPDMTQHGFERDDWPKIYAAVQAADILVIGTPIWLGERSSVCSRLIERLYGHSGDTNERGQYVYYGKVGGCIVTGNEDGFKNVAKGLHFALQHLGFLIPPQSDAGWIGEAGPGLSYGDSREDGTRAGFDNMFTQRLTTFMSWNLMHMARLLKDAGGFPTYGNDVNAWADGERFDHPQLPSKEYDVSAGPDIKPEGYGA